MFLWVVGQWSARTAARTFACLLASLISMRFRSDFSASMHTCPYAPNVNPGIAEYALRWSSQQSAVHSGAGDYPEPAEPIPA